MFRTDAQDLRTIALLLFVSHVFYQHFIDTALLPAQMPPCVFSLFVPILEKKTDLFEFILRGQAHHTCGFM
jgi:hypothetical protein